MGKKRKKEKAKCPWCGQENVERRTLAADEGATEKNSNILEICLGCAMPYLVRVSKKGKMKTSRLAPEDVESMSTFIKNVMHEYMNKAEEHIDAKRKK